MIKFRKMLEKDEIRKILQKKGAVIYFVGIGGISMSSLALMLKGRGISVSGSDIRRSESVDYLIKRGINVRIGHSREAIMSSKPDMAVFSLSVDSSNAEYKAARDMNIPTVTRSELLGALMDDYKIKIGVSGSHGKSTVSAMIYEILREAGCSPTLLCGADIFNGVGIIEGEGDYLVYEACEYGDSFLDFSPTVQLLLNLELDHTDYFKSESDIRDSFLKAGNLASKCCIINLDSKNLEFLSDRIKPKLYSFSKNDGAGYKYDISKKERGVYSFKLYRKNRLIGEYSASAKGRLNMENAVAAAVCADVIGIDPKFTERALLNFCGIKRRLELINREENFDVFYDYAHHPTEIRSTLEALRDMEYENIAVIFAPHTYSRTQSFLKDFAKELAKFDTVYVTDIWGARENAIVGVNSSSLAAEVSALGTAAHAVSDKELERTVENVKNSNFDCVVLMGAGNLEGYKEKFVKI